MGNVSASCLNYTELKHRKTENDGGYQNRLGYSIDTWTNHGCSIIQCAQSKVFGLATIGI